MYYTSIIQKTVEGYEYTAMKMLLGFEVNFKRRLRRVSKSFFNELCFTEREGKPTVAGDGLTALALEPQAIAIDRDES